MKFEYRIISRYGNNINHLKDINELGLLRWELISSYVVEYNEDFDFTLTTYIFKREKI